jgi:hypothetical protein
MIIKNIPSTSNKHLEKYLERAISDATLLTEGKNWYKNAHKSIRDIAVKHKLTLPVVCGITARLSPSISWNRNLIATTRLIEGEDSIDGYKRNVDIAHKILNGDFGKSDCDVSTSFPKTARKTFSFYHNLLRVNKSYHVTIDRWMLRAAVSEFHGKKFPSEFQIHRSVYEQISDDIRRIASKYNLFPIQVQACIWLEIRKSWNKSPTK